MRAMVLPRFGEPELLEAREVERPEPGPGEVLVRVVASGTNPVDAKLPLERVADAHRRLDTGHGRGKIVLRVAEEPDG